MTAPTPDDGGAAGTLDRLDRVAAALRSRRVSSVDLVEGCLDRLASDHTTNAVVEVDADAARRAARRADRQLRSNRAVRSWLTGIPVTVKRTFAVRGCRDDGDEADTAPAPQAYARRDAAVVEFLRAAGAVVLGRTNAPARGADIDTWHEWFGRTAHPTRPELSPGGSSGGSAAAVASGHTWLDVGSDTAGSARIPAHACGVYALRPTFGRISVRGHAPGTGPAGMLAASPIARRAGDLRMVGRALLRPGGAHPVRCVPGPVAAALADASTPMDPELSACLAAAVDRLGAAGIPIEPVALPVDLAENWLVCQQLLYADAVPTAGSRPGPRPATPTAGADPLEIALWCAGMTRQDRQRLWCRRAVLRTRWHRFFDRHRALLLPVFGTTALPPRDHRVPLLADEVTVDGRVVPVFALSSWCAVASVAGLPAVSMPVGRTGDGLPVGLQVLGRPGADEALLDLVEQFAQVLR